MRDKEALLVLPLFKWSMENDFGKLLLCVHSTHTVRNSYSISKVVDCHVKGGRQFRTIL